MIVGYYVTCDDAVCLEHYDRDAWEGFEGWEDPLAISSDDEADTPTHCVECGKLIEHDLTPDGYSYVGEAILRCFTEGKQSPVVRIWTNAYGDWLGDIGVAQDGTELDWQATRPLFEMLPMDDHPAFEQYRRLLGVEQ